VGNSFLLLGEVIVQEEDLEEDIKDKIGKNVDLDSVDSRELDPPLFNPKSNVRVLSEEGNSLLVNLKLLGATFRVQEGNLVVRMKGTGRGVDNFLLLLELSEEDSEVGSLVRTVSLSSFSLSLELRALTSHRVSVAISFFRDPYRSSTSPTLCSQCLDDRDRTFLYSRFSLYLDFV
jgi:hypothetical protein